MYIPEHFREERIEVMHDLMRAYPLATLVTLAESGIVADHIPTLLSAETVPFGILQGHVSRANPVWRDARPDVEALAVFQGPQSYISPSWYPSKQETGRVVPTWDYAVVHAYGSLRVIDDPDWLRSQVERLTVSQEAGFAQPWNVSDAPEDFIRQLIGGIVGIEMVVTRLSGKWKMSGNQSAANRAGVIGGLRSLSANALAVADLIPVDTED